MKKIVIILTVVVCCASFASCKKECECKLGFTLIDIPKNKIIDTKEDCNAHEDTLKKDIPGIKCVWKY